MGTTVKGGLMASAGVVGSRGVVKGGTMASAGVLGTRGTLKGGLMPSVGGTIVPPVASVTIADVPAMLATTAGAPLVFTLGKAVSPTGLPTAMQYSIKKNGGAALPIKSLAYSDTVAGDTIQLIATGSDGVNTPVTVTGNTVTVGAARTYPTIANNRLVLCGDSRTQGSSTQTSVSATTVTTYAGYEAWLDILAQFSVNTVANMGINGETIQGLDGRRNSGQGNSLATGSSPTWKGEYLVNDPAASAAIFFVLIGINSNSNPLATRQANFTLLARHILDAGKVMLLANETPNNNVAGGGGGDSHYQFAQWLSTWPASDTSLTTAEKATYSAKTLVVPTYDMLVDRTQANPWYTRPDLNFDELHPKSYGNYQMAEAIASVLIPLLKANGLYAPKNVIPTTQAGFFQSNAMLKVGTSTTISATNGESAGSGGSNMDGNGGVGVQGTVPTGWVLSRDSTFQALANGTQGAGAQISVTSEKIVDSDGYDGVRLKIFSAAGVGSYSGTGFALNLIATQGLTNSQWNALNVPDGSRLYAIGRRIVKANPKGMLAAALRTGLSAGTGFSNLITVQQNTAGGPGSQVDVFEEIDQVVKGTPFTIPAGLGANGNSKTLTTALIVTMMTGVPIDITIELSHAGMVMNYDN